MVYNFAKFHYSVDNRAHFIISNTILIEVVSFANNWKQEKAWRMRSERLPRWFYI